MAKINQLKCAVVGGNTGLPSSCTFNPDLIVGAIAMPKGTLITEANLASFQTYLAAKFINDTYSSRFHRFGKFEGMDDQSEDRVQHTYPYGRKITTKDSVYQWMFTYIDGAMCAHKNYLQFKDREDEFEFLFVDKSGNFLGTIYYSTTTNERKVKGIKLSELYPANWKPKDGSNETVYSLTFGIKNARDLNENLAVIQTDFDVFDMDVVMDAEIVLLEAIDGSGDVDMTIIAGCGGSQNLVDLYGTALVATANINVTNAETGAAITKTSVTVAGNSPDKYFTLNLDFSDTDYPASGKYIRVDLVAPSVLIAASVAALDAKPLFIPVP
jgi:hypothetical protein